MQNNYTIEAGGAGVTGLLGIVFVVLKLCGVIDWSWWWVTSPFWIPLALVVLILVVSLIIVGIKATFKTSTKRYRE